MDLTCKFDGACEVQAVIETVKDEYASLIYQFIVCG